MFVVHALNRLLSALFGSPIVSVPEHLVRKGAHVFEYLVLGGLFLSGFFTASRPLRSAIIALSAGFLYAASDEFHQIFIPGRTASPYDVGLDTIAVLAGIFLCLPWFRRRFKT